MTPTLAPLSDDDFETLGQMVDTLDAVTYSAKLPVPAEIHVKGLLGTIESTRDQLKQLLVARGFNPWSD